MQWLVGALVVLVLAIVIGTDRFGPSRETTSPQRPVPGPATVVSADASVAVLPFEDLTDDVDDPYFAEGVAREVTGLLERFPALEVASISSAFQFRGDQSDSMAIADELGVGSLLTGSLRREGGRIQAQVSLTDGASGSVLWSERFDRPEAEVFLIQDEIAHQVAGLLGGAPAHSSPPATRQATTANIEAFTLFLRGRSLIDQRIDLGAPPLHEALESFQAASQLDPDFVRAHVGMASTYFWIDPVLDLTCIFFTQLSPSSSYPNRPQFKALVHGALID